MRPRRLAVLLVLLALVLSANGLAQTTNATLGGSVADSSGALLPGVEVTATNVGTGIVTTTITNESGAYNYPSLQNGTYTVAAALPGFQTYTFSNVALGVSQQVRLNFTLKVGTVSTNVEVSVAADTLLATSSSSVGAVLPEYKVRDLPLQMGNVMDLIPTTPGTTTSAGFQGAFAGSRVSQTNVVRDGLSITDGRYEFGAFGATYSSPDLVEEVRVITAPVDAETSRGVGQVQMVTRSGTNQFRGSAFWTNHNSALDSALWFNNFNNAPKNYDNRHEYGVRLGGPIIKNKTFFFAFFEGQRDLKKEVFIGSTLTATAKQGIFRYFPGADNGNASSLNPTVNVNGDPVTPKAAIGPLSSFSVFDKKDPLRTGFDQSAFGKQTLALMPDANNFTIGDGLNTAGVRFVRRISGRDVGVGFGEELNRDQYNVRIDHQFNAKHKISVVGTKEHDWADDGQGGLRQWPLAYDGFTYRRPQVYTINFISTLSNSMVNQLTLGRRVSVNNAYDSGKAPTASGAAAAKFIPQSNGVQFQVNPIEFQAPIRFGGFGLWREGYNPMNSLGDTLSWTRGKHALKAGFEMRRTYSNAFNDPDITPRAVFGAGGQAVTGIDSTTIPNLSGTNTTAARNLLLDLSGSVGQVFESFTLKSPQDLTFYNSPDVLNNRHFNHQNEFSGFVKDDWKVTGDLTLNLGVHYEWYGQPYEEHGLAGVPVGGAAQLRCGYACGLVTMQFVGKNSPHPDLLTNRNDWNNLGPSIGFSWNVPKWGKNKTVLRAGYGIVYTGALRNFITVDSTIGATPGAFLGSGSQGVVYQPTTYTNLSSVSLPIPKPTTAALQPIPLTDRSLNLLLYDRVSPYTQNFNVEIQRSIAANTTVEIRYIATKGTKLWGDDTINYDDIYSNGILQAFNDTRAGKDAPLFDQMLKGISLGNGAVGPTLSGSAALRSNTTTRALIANGNVGGLADFLNRNNTGTGQNGGLLRVNGLAENFIVRNPQFNGVAVQANTSSSNYHSLQLQLTKRLSHGFTNASTFVWSKAMGDSGGDSGQTWIDPRNRSLNHSLLGFDHRYSLVSNGTFELPFGPNRMFLSGTSHWLQRAVERWQLGGIMNWNSGDPLTVTSGLSTVTQNSVGMPVNVVGNFPKNVGTVTKVSNGVIYFPGLQQVADPAAANVSPLNGLSGNFSNKAIADAQGNLLLTNPAPGTVGNLGLFTLTGPGSFTMDMNLSKSIRISETKEFQFRVNAINVLNHPVFSDPNTSMNSAGNFGRITSTVGSFGRQFVTTLRMNF
jgi:hypothetical protein